MNPHTKLALLAAGILSDVDSSGAPTPFAIGCETVADENPPERPQTSHTPAPIVYNAGGRISIDTPGKRVRDKGARRLIRARAKREAKDARALERELARKERK